MKCCYSYIPYTMAENKWVKPWGGVIIPILLAAHVDSAIGLPNHVPYDSSWFTQKKHKRPTCAANTRPTYPPTSHLQGVACLIGKSYQCSIFRQGTHIDVIRPVGRPDWWVLGGLWRCFFSGTEERECEIQGMSRFFGEFLDELLVLS